MTERKNYIDIIAVLIFTTVMVIIPWEEIQGKHFVDRAVYIQNILYESSIFEYKSFDSLIDYFTNEVIWHHLMLTLVHDLSIPVSLVFMLISFFCIGTFSLFLVSRHGPISLILLVNPLLITLAFSQLRIALAYPILLVAYRLQNMRIVSASLIVTACLIHTASIIFVVIYLAVKIVEKMFERQKVNSFPMFILFCVMGLCISLAIGPLKELVLNYIGDRRANLTGDASSSLTYTLYWIGLLGLFSMQSKSFLKDEVNGYSVVILSLVSFNILTGGYTLRFLSVALPMLLSSLLSMSGNTRSIGLLAYIVYSFFQWVYWMPVEII